MAYCVNSDVIRGYSVKILNYKFEIEQIYLEPPSDRTDLKDSAGKVFATVQLVENTLRVTAKDDSEDFQVVGSETDCPGNPEQLKIGCNLKDHTMYFVGKNKKTTAGDEVPIQYEVVFMTDVIRPEIMGTSLDGDVSETKEITVSSAGSGLPKKKPLTRGSSLRGSGSRGRFEEVDLRRSESLSRPSRPTVPIRQRTILKRTQSEFSDDLFNRGSETSVRSGDSFAIRKSESIGRRANSWQTDSPRGTSLDGITNSEPVLKGRPQLRRPSPQAGDHTGDSLLTEKRGASTPRLSSGPHNSRGTRSSTDLRDRSASLSRPGAPKSEGTSF